MNATRTSSRMCLIAGLAVFALAGCQPKQAAEAPQLESGPDPDSSAVRPADELGGPTPAPTRWVIDGTTLAEDPGLPLALARALREFGRASEDVQDRIVIDLNGDDQLDAVALLPAPDVAGAYDHLVLLSDGDEVRVHAIAELVPGASFSAAVVPLVDGPTLIGVAPRIGGCGRGPEWTFLRPTGAMLEMVGSVRVADYDCAVAEASVEFDRGADGRVAAIVVRHGDVITRYGWDASLGSFAAIGD